MRVLGFCGVWAVGVQVFRVEGFRVSGLGLSFIEASEYFVHKPLEFLWYRTPKISLNPKPYTPKTLNLWTQSPKP